MPGHWMQKAAQKIKSSGHSGIFRRAAERAGKSTQGFAHEHDTGNSKLAKRARLAEAFAKAKH